jgi:hypothetical protein
MIPPTPLFKGGLTGVLPDVQEIGIKSRVFSGNLNGNPSALITQTISQTSAQPKSLNFKFKMAN